MEIIITKKFKGNYDNNPLKPKPIRPFGGRPKKAETIKNKKKKSYNNIRKDGFYKLDFT
tara:strand:- start:31 stop:207 length:177 start_codon:yes stop_codon:yes gene_type:complete